MAEAQIESILDSVKKVIGPSVEYTVFDPDLVMHINTLFFTLYQLGVTEEPFVITGNDETWEDFHANTDLEAVKTYIVLKNSESLYVKEGSALNKLLSTSFKDEFNKEGKINLNSIELINSSFLSALKKDHFPSKSPSLIFPNIVIVSFFNLNETLLFT